MVTLTDDEVALIRKRSSPKEPLLAALRSSKVRDIDKAMGMCGSGVRIIGMRAMRVRLRMGLYGYRVMKVLVV